MTEDALDRDFVGYGGRPPRFEWAPGARLALVVVMNVEEGAEPSIPDGDPASETALTDAIAGEVPAGTRDLAAESLFEYGARAGAWRLLRLFDGTGTPPTITACARALLRNPPLAAAISRAGHDVCAHGDGFRRHFLMSREEEARTIAAAVAGIDRAIGRKPTGWQSRYAPSVHTRELLRAHDCLIYDADSYADDLPCWRGDRLIVPHTFTLNDNRLPGGKLGTAEDFLDHLNAAYRTLRRETEAGETRLMTISLHARVSGHPARFDAIARFLDGVAGQAGLWRASRAEVARRFAQVAPRPGPGTGAAR